MTPYKFKEPIYVTKPFLPPLSGFCKGLEEIWDSKWLTNSGPILNKFKNALEEFFNTQNVCLFNNGTLALQIGLQGLNISGEVITTPFSFVATSHALYWNKIRPVFCDIEPDYYTLDPDKIESLITPWTTAILAVHVFGHPCHVEKLSQIAKKYRLMLIYDSAHAFGVEINGKSIANYGDMSMFSFHATKLFHTFEGGMLIFKDKSLKNILNYLKNFGFESETEVVMPGTNAKMSEVQALMGLQMLQYIDKMIGKHKQINDTYRERLSGIPGIQLSKPTNENVRYNFSYMLVEIHEDEFGMSRDFLYNKLKEYNIFTRRYFYPLICDFPCYRSLSITDPLTEARRITEQILNLPIYYDLSLDEVNRICDIIIHIHKKGK